MFEILKDTLCSNYISNNRYCVLKLNNGFIFFDS